MSRSIGGRVALAALVYAAGLGAGCGPAPTAVVVTSPAAVVPDISGAWTTRWGRDESCRLDLTQDGARIAGSYTTTGAPPGAVSGTFDGVALTGSWSDDAGGGGGMVLTFTADGRSFAGTWGVGASSTDGGTWEGRRGSP